MFDVKNYLITALVASQFIWGYIGYTYEKDKCVIEISQIREDAGAELQTALIKKDEQNNVYREALSSAQSSVGMETEEIDRHFDRLVSVGLSDNRNGADSLSLSDNKDNAGGNTGVSDTTQTARAVSECKCKCPADYRAKLQRLYREQLTVARDCDITSSKYNELIRFYDEISKGTE